MSKISVTHVGSLPRSQDVVDFIFARENNEPYDQESFDRCMSSAVSDTVAKQVAVGVDIVSDGEMSNVDLIGTPGGRGGVRSRRQGKPEYRQLEPEAPARFGFEISRDVPPLGLVFRVRRVVTGEFPAVPRFGRAPRRRSCPGGP